MLRNLKKIFGFTLFGEGQEYGTIKDFYFDEDKMKIRYGIVDTGTWLKNRKVLISPKEFMKPDFEHGVLPVELTKKEIEESPPISKEKPLSQIMEEKVTNYFEWPKYWIGTSTGEPVNANFLLGEKIKEMRQNKTNKEQREKYIVAREGNKETNLRSSKEVIGYNIKAIDGEIGKLDGLIVEDNYWLIRYLIIDTGKWLPSRKVIFPPEWLEGISWNKEQIIFPFSKEEIRHAPDYDPDVPVSRVYEEKLYEYYQKQKYWKL